MIHVDGLTKRYGDRLVVDSASFSVAPGSVTGFLGPNGAGKSTCMRMLLGLARPDHGSATILGERYANLANPAFQVGALLDAGAQHQGRSGHTCLAIQADVLGIDARRIDETVERVGLTPREARTKVRDYSLGMRQRLGLAQALLGDPRVLVLDEPVNGLDPSGIRWIRHLLRDFADRGGAVLLSSHLLAEVEHIADAYVLIAAGRIVKSGRKEEFASTLMTTVSSVDDERLLAEISHAGIDANRKDDHILVQATAEEVGAIAFSAGVQLRELSPSTNDLEETFLSMLAHTERDHRPQ